MHEDKTTLTVQIDGKEVKIEFKEPTVDDQLKYAEFIDSLSNVTGTKDLLERQIPFIAQATGLDAEQVRKMRGVDKDKIAEMLLNRNLQFAKQIRNFTVN